MHKSKKQRMHDKRIIMAIRNTCKELNKDKTAYKYVVIGKHIELFDNIPKLRMRNIYKGRNNKMIDVRVSPTVYIDKISIDMVRQAHMQLGSKMLLYNIL